MSPLLRFGYGVFGEAEKWAVLQTPVVLVLVLVLAMEIQPSFFDYENEEDRLPK
jgi:hypothetical protein